MEIQPKKPTVNAPAETFTGDAWFDVTKWRGLVQSRGGEVIEIRPGDTIYPPPGEWHWHGAAPDHFMTHIAMSEGTGDGPETQWEDQATEDEYGRR